MRRGSMTFIAIASMSAILVAAMIREVPAADDRPPSRDHPALDNATPVEGAVAAQSAGGFTYHRRIESEGATRSVGDAPYNRRIDGIGFAPSSTGATNVIVSYSMHVGDTGATADLSGEILIDVLVDGTVVSTGVFPGQFDFISNDAITCAVTCVSNCGSIFGDGVCGGCDCSYDRVGSLPLTVPAGATVRASLIVFVTPEIITEDDSLEVVFGEPTVPCAEDLNGDGVVGVDDLLRLLAKWGPCS